MRSPLFWFVVFPICRLAMNFLASFSSMAWPITVITPNSRLLIHLALIFAGFVGSSIYSSESRIFKWLINSLFSQHDKSTAFLSWNFRKNFTDKGKRRSTNNFAPHFIKLDIESSKKLVNLIVLHCFLMVVTIFWGFPFIIIV